MNIYRICVVSLIIPAQGQAEGFNSVGKAQSYGPEGRLQSYGAGKKPFLEGMWDPVRGN